MMWIGLIAGIAVGSLIGGVPGAITCGFLGWLAGLIIKSQKQKPGPGTGQVPVPGVGQVPDQGQVRTGAGSAPGLVFPDRSSWTVEDRLAKLEATVAQLEAALAKAGVAPDAAPAATVGSPIS